ncbi:MAG TPA: ABC transporter ATP-binding protein [Candidatus Limnocylindria bacterium]|nr:ABC transporter ATP-binding protein [Candidatus Limnocylindria bacterium]
MTIEPILVLEHLRKSFPQRGGGAPVVAVDDVSLSVGAGKTLALVGESGSGKSTLARLAQRLIDPDEGQIVLRGLDLTHLTGRRLREQRIAMQPIFQDPSTSFNPRRTVGGALLQALWRTPSATRIRCAEELLERVRLRPASFYLPRFPHELSGGQRQRLAIARAIAMDPVLVIADEPLSGSDVSIRSQMLNLLADLQKERGIAYLLITHDISIARAFADRVAVMYRGRLVEEGDPAVVLRDPSHEYTKRLLGAVPQLAGAAVPAWTSIHERTRT